MKRLFFLAALALSLPGIAQKVSNRLQFAPGAKYEWVAAVNSVVSQEVGGQTIEAKVNGTVTRLFDVESVSNGKTALEHKVKRIQLQIDAPMMGNESFDSENEADMKGERGKVMEKALKNKYHMVVDPAGTILEVKADDDNPHKSAAAANDMMSSTLSQIAEGLELPKAGASSDFRVLPNREVARGDTWSDSSAAGKATYTVTDITATDILLNYTEEAETRRKQEAMGTEISISTKDKTTGTITLDRATGLLKEKKGTTQSEGMMEAMGQRFPMSTTITRTVTVRKM